MKLNEPPSPAEVTLEDAVVENPDGLIPTEDNTITFTLADGREVLRVTPEGFFVEGRPVDVVNYEEHDRTVYQALKRALAGWTPRPPSPGLSREGAATLMVKLGTSWIKTAEERLDLPQKPNMDSVQMALAVVDTLALLGGKDQALEIQRITLQNRKRDGFTF